MHHVVAVEPRGSYRIWVRFEDGFEAEIDLGTKLQFDGVFAPLSDSDYFARVAVHPELRVVRWPNDADIDTEVLYAWAKGRTVEDVEQEYWRLSRRVR